jgi:hypothetical protein
MFQMGNFNLGFNITMKLGKFERPNWLGQIRVGLGKMGCNTFEGLRLKVQKLLNKKS